MIKIIINPNNSGITQRSLCCLRDELAARATHTLQVHQLSTGDITCGFLIIDTQKWEAAWTGDGFRTDRGGEGGAGFRTAEILLGLYSITPHHGDIAFVEPGDEETELERKLQKYIEQWEHARYEEAINPELDDTPYLQKAQYVRW